MYQPTYTIQVDRKKFKDQFTTRIPSILDMRYPEQRLLFQYLCRDILEKVIMPELDISAEIVATVEHIRLLLEQAFRKEETKKIIQDLHNHLPAAAVPAELCALLPKNRNRKVSIGDVPWMTFQLVSAAEADALFSNTPAHFQKRSQEKKAFFSSLGCMFDRINLSTLHEWSNGTCKVVPLYNSTLPAELVPNPFRSIIDRFSGVCRATSMGIMALLFFLNGGNSVRHPERPAATHVPSKTFEFTIMDERVLLVIGSSQEFPQTTEVRCHIKKEHDLAATLILHMQKGKVLKGTFHGSVFHAHDIPDDARRYLVQAIQNNTYLAASLDRGTRHNLGIN